MARPTLLLLSIDKDKPPYRAFDSRDVTGSRRRSDRKKSDIDLTVVCGRSGGRTGRGMSDGDTEAARGAKMDVPPGPTSRYTRSVAEH